MELKEIVNEERLKEVLECGNIIFRHEDKTEKQRDIYKRRIYKYYKEPLRDGFRIIKYELGENSSEGRLFAKPLGLQGFKRELRVYICDNLYDDYDIVSCHPNIINYLFKKYDIKSSLLKSYIDNRTEFLVEYKIDKSGFLSFINTSYCKIKGLNDLHRLIYENLFNNLIKEYDALWNACNNNKKNVKGSFLNKVLCIIERDILDTTFKYLKNLDIIPNVYTFDGFMLLKGDANNIDLDKLNQHLRIKYSYDFTFINKDMNGEWKPIKGDDNIMKLCDKEYHTLYDKELAEIFIKFLNEKGYIFIYNTKEEKFYYNTSGIWNLDENNNELIKFFISTEFYDYCKSKCSAKDLHKILNTYKFMYSCFKYLQSIIGRNIEFNRQGNLFAFKNGVYDLDKNIFRDIVKDDYILFTCGYNYIEKDSNKVYEYINSLFETVEVVDYVIKSISLGLYGKQLDKSINIWSGCGDNGKSLFQALIFKSFGKYAGTINPNFFVEKQKNSNSASPELHDARYYRILSTSEPEENSEFNCNVIKQLTGKDLIKTRTLNEKPVEWLPMFKIYLLANGIPRFTDKTMGFSSRIRIVKFKYRFIENPTQQNHKKLENIEFSDDFIEEFLYLLIKYWKNIKLPLFVPDCIKMDTNEYIQDNDKNARFIDECLTKTGNVDDIILSNDMYNLYTNWAEYNKILEGFRKKQRGLTSYLKGKDFIYKRQNGVSQFFQNVVRKDISFNIKEDEDDNEDIMDCCR